jgi:hypothetical protein
MAAEFEDNYGDQNVDIDITAQVDAKQQPYLSIILTKVQTADDFVDLHTADVIEIESFFEMVERARVQYNLLRHG